MVLIRFRIPKNKFCQIELDPATTILQTKENLSKMIEGSNPSKINMLFKAKLLKDNQTIGSLNLSEKDYILVHTYVPPPKVKYGDNVYAINSPEAYQILKELLQDLTQTIAPVQPDGNPIDRVFTRVIQLQPRALENVIGILERFLDPSIRQHLDLFISSHGLNPSLLPVDDVRNRRAQPVDIDTFGATIERACNDLGIDPGTLLGSIPSGNGPARPPPPVQAPQQQEEQNTISQLMAQLTPEDREAVQRLAQISNCPIDYVIQVYLAADKNENTAANILLS